MLYEVITLFAGQIIEASGWTGRLSTLVRPLMRWGHLSDSSGASFTTAFVSGTAAQAMLVTFHEEGKPREIGHEADAYEFRVRGGEKRNNFV